jgi:hypothetical protein
LSFNSMQASVAKRDVINDCLNGQFAVSITFFTQSFDDMLQKLGLVYSNFV